MDRRNFLASLAAVPTVAAIRDDRRRLRAPGQRWTGGRRRGGIDIAIFNHRCPGWRRGFARIAGNRKGDYRDGRIRPLDAQEEGAVVAASDLHADGPVDRRIGRGAGRAEVDRIRDLALREAGKRAGWIGGVLVGLPGLR